MTPLSSHAKARPHTTLALSLPEIIHSIASHLSSNDIASCSRVNSAFHALFTPPLWHSVNLCEYSHYTASTGSLRNAQRLNPVAGVSRVEKAILARKRVHLFVDSVRYVQVDAVDWILDLGPDCRNLKEVRFRYNPYAVNEKRRYRGGLSSGSLLEQWAKLDPVEEPMPDWKTKSLCLGYPVDRSSMIWSDLFGMNQRLETVWLDLMAKEDLNLLGEALCRLPCLRELGIGAFLYREPAASLSTSSPLPQQPARPPRSLHQFFADLLLGCQQLRRFSFELITEPAFDMSWISDHVLPPHLSVLVPPLPPSTSNSSRHPRALQLQLLDLRSTQSLKGISSILRICPAILSIAISPRENLDTLAEVIKNHCPHLQDLVVSTCDLKSAVFRNLLMSMTTIKSLSFETCHYSAGSFLGLLESTGACWTIEELSLRAGRAFIREDGGCAGGVLKRCPRLKKLITDTAADVVSLLRGGPGESWACEGTLESLDLYIYSPAITAATSTPATTAEGDPERMDPTLLGPELLQRLARLRRLKSLTLRRPIHFKCLVLDPTLVVETLERSMGRLETLTIYGCDFKKVSAPAASTII